MVFVDFNFSSFGNHVPQEHFKTDKAFNMKFIPSFIALLVAFLFTYFGFFETQPCDLDAIFLSCRLNPFTIFDLIGCTLFYGGCLFIALAPLLEKFELYNPEGSSAWNIGLFVSMVLGITLIWNL